MAKYSVGSGVTSAASSRTTQAHGLQVAPKVAIAIGNRTSHHTTARFPRFSIAASTGDTAPPGQQGVLYNSFFATSAFATVIATSVYFVNSDGANFAGGTTAEATFENSDGVNFAANDPLLFSLLGGDDVAAAVRAFSISTSTGTQTCTGFGFTPNVAVLFGACELTSVASFSLGVVAETSAGDTAQWHLSQVGRTAPTAQVHKQASTKSGLRLLTTGAVSHDVMFSSFRTSGVDLRVAVSDTARPASMAVLAMNVPNIRVGATTVDADGVLSVTGLGQNVGLVVLAGAGDTGTTSIAANNRFSVGFGDSAGNQNCVSLLALNGAASSADYMSYQDSSHILNELTTATIAKRGTFTATTDGFRTTGDGTQLTSGLKYYYAAFSNVVQDISAAINSSFTMNANTSEVARMSAAIGSSFSMNANAEPQFIPTEGKVHAQATIETRTERDDDRTYNVISNSSSPDYTDYMNVTTTPQSLRVANYQNAKHLTIIPPSTNTVPLRLSGSLNSPGFPISSRGQNSIAISERSGNDLYLHTTSTGTTIEGVRVILR